jgi:hypothetical protein
LPDPYPPYPFPRRLGKGRCNLLANEFLLLRLPLTLYPSPTKGEGQWFQQKIKAL